MATILIADDSPHNLYLARFLLEKHDHRIIEARNGQEAVELSTDNPVDLILMDIQMPVMDGLEAIRIIKGRENSPVIVALTGKAMRRDRDEILACGCDGYIEKPIDPGSFPDEVAIWLVNNSSNPIS